MTNLSSLLTPFLRRYVHSRLTVGLLPLALVVLALGTACTQLASPTGWAGPVVVDNTLLTVPEKGKLAAYDLSQNRLLWQFPTDGLKHRDGKDIKPQAIYTTATVSQGTVYLGGYDGYVYALDQANGNLRWEFKTDGAIVGGLLVEQNTVYLGSSGGSVYALNVADGELKWARPFDAGGRIWAKPALEGGVLYVSSLENVVYAIDAQTGALRGPRFKAEAGIASTPVIAQGKVLVGTLGSKLYALDANNLENVVWQFSADNWFWAEPLVDRKVVYAGSLDGNIYAIDIATGNQLWQRDLGEPIRARPILAQGILVVVTRGGEVWGLNPNQEGQPIWAAPSLLGNNVLSDPFLRGDTVYITDTDGALHGIRVTDGSAVPVPDLKSLILKGYDYLALG